MISAWFLPILVACIAATGVVLAALISRGNNTADRIEIIVNSRYTKLEEDNKRLTAAVSDKDAVIATKDKVIDDLLRRIKDGAELKDA